MTNTENLPFPRGSVGTAYSDPSTRDITGLAHLEGTIWHCPDYNYSVGPGLNSVRTNRMVTLMVVRNSNTVAVLPKKVVKHKIDSTALVASGQIDGYAAVIGTDWAAGVVDEWLPAAGAAVGDLFYIVVKGPSKVTTDGSGDTTIVTGNYVIFATAGTVVDEDRNPAAGTATSNQQNSLVGRALEGVAAISTDFLIDVDLY